MESTEYGHLIKYKGLSMSMFLWEWRLSRSVVFIFVHKEVDICGCPDFNFTLRITWGRFGITRWCQMQRNVCMTDKTHSWFHRASNLSTLYPNTLPYSYPRHLEEDSGFTTPLPPHLNWYNKYDLLNCNMGLYVILFWAQWLSNTRLR